MLIKIIIKVNWLEYLCVYLYIFYFKLKGAMSMNKGSLNQEKLNLDSLFELLNHNETNYAFFAVSRIKVISKIIGII